MAGGAFILGARWRSADARAASFQASAGTDAASALTAWVRVPARGAVTLIMLAVGDGPGDQHDARGALAQELFVSFDAVYIEFAPFGPDYRDPVYNWMFTGNSQGISSFYEVMRQMGAAAREMLRVCGGRSPGRSDAHSSSAAARRQSARYGAHGVVGDVAAAAAATCLSRRDPTPRAESHGRRSLCPLGHSSKVDGSAPCSAST